jgi:predicted RNase H-like nuclease (RuvC/YqgF family)
VLAAVVLYGAHVNHTLLDPDEVALLEALAKAAATSHQQVRIAMLTREMERQRTRVGELEASSAELRELVQVRLSGPQGAGRV